MINVILSEATDLVFRMHGPFCLDNEFLRREGYSFDKHWIGRIIQAQGALCTIHY